MTARVKYAASIVSAASAAFFLSVLALPASVLAEDVVAPLVVTPIASPNPALGTDNLTHLAYEFTLMSMASSGVTIEKVETLDAETNKVIGTLDGDARRRFSKSCGRRGSRSASIMGSTSISAT